MPWVKRGVGSMTCCSSIPPGRLHVDDEMMQEVRDLGTSLNPIETLFVVDSMAGQDAVNAARAFGAALNLTGVVLTKADGDARGGAALSVRQVTGQPILFMGTGEKPDALEAFQPDRMASRILGMGDVLSLVEQVTQQVNRDDAEKLARKVAKGKGFDLDDLLSQLRQIEQMGGVAALMDKLPSQLAAKAGQMPQGNEKEVKRQIAIICSMTPVERRYPEEYRRVAQAPHRGRIRHPRGGNQPPAEELPADAEDDERHGQRRPGPHDAVNGRPNAAGPALARHKYFFYFGICL